MLLTCGWEDGLELHHVPTVVCGTVASANAEVAAGEHDTRTSGSELSKHVADGSIII